MTELQRRCGDCGFATQLKGSTTLVVCIAHLDYRSPDSTAICDAFTAQQFFRVGNFSCAHAKETSSDKTE